MSGCEPEGELPPSEPDYRAFLTVLMNESMVSVGTAEEGGRFIVMAMRGLSVRHHFDTHHPELVARGPELMAPPKEQDREAWLFGYRFVERKEAP